MWAALVVVAAGCSSPAQPTGGATAIALPRLSVTRFLAFGDSITAGAIAGADGVTLSFVDPSLAYPGQLQTSLRQRYAAQPIVVVNDGLSGETAVDGAARLPAELSRYHPQVLLLLEGVNDLHGRLGQNGFPPAISALRIMIQQAQASGAQVVVGTLPPAVPGALFPSTVALIDPFNAELMSMALESGALIVDLHAAFLVNLAAWIGPDGLHLSVEGYQQLAQVFLASIQAKFEVR
jgi:lysophospholipase L1-like esterase